MDNNALALAQAQARAEALAQPANAAPIGGIAPAGAAPVTQVQQVAAPIISEQAPPVNAGQQFVDHAVAPGGPGGQSGGFPSADITPDQVPIVTPGTPADDPTSVSSRTDAVRARLESLKNKQ